MTDTKFTPGPWKISKIVETWIKADGNSHVATIPQEFDGDYCKANAHLIASAPAMYEALDNLENDDGKSMPPSAWKLVENALKTARGES